MPVKFRIILVLGLLTLGLGYYTWQHLQAEAEPMMASGTLESTEIQLASKLGGRVLERYVKEGQDVKSGDPLLRFDVAELQARLQQVQAQYQGASAQVALVKAGARPEEIRQAQAAWRASQIQLSQLQRGNRQAEIERAQADVMAGETRLNLAQKEWQRTRALVQEGVLSIQARDRAQQQLEAAQAALILAQKNLELVQAGPRIETVQIAREQVHQSGAQLQRLQRGARVQEIEVAQAQQSQIAALEAQLKIQLKEEKLQAPCACRVSILGAEPGEVISPGSPVITLQDPDDLWVKVYLSPLELKAVRLKQAVRLRVDAYPGREFKGQVVHIASEAEFTPRNIQTREERVHQVFAIKVQVLPKQSELFPGMPVDVVWQEP